MKTATRIFAAALALAAVAGPARSGEMHKAPESSSDLQRLKGLVGSWEGVQDGDKEAKKLSVEYSLTAGGSALVEKLFPGTPHEMLSVYYDQGGKVAMTHYCMLGNQPLMSLKKSDAKSFQFELAKTPGLNPSKDQHMHALILTLEDPDHLTQKWTSYEGGKPKESSVFRLARASKSQ